MPDSFPLDIFSGIAYNTNMRKYQIVVDTNVFLAALRSSSGASHLLFQRIGSGAFELNISVPLILEYEAVAKRCQEEIGLANEEIDDIIDYICSKANERQIRYLWRPHLKDPKDDMVLELAVAAGCSHVITFNRKDFINIGTFGIQAVGPKQFLHTTGDL